MQLKCYLKNYECLECVWKRRQGTHLTFRVKNNWITPLQRGTKKITKHKINKIENKRVNKRIIQAKSWFFEKNT